jgi:hypothetical protein
MPLGIDDLILDLLNKRVQYCANQEYRCDSCRGTLRSGEGGIAIPAAPDHHGAAPANGQCASCPFTVQADGTITDSRKTVNV